MNSIRAGGSDPEAFEAFYREHLEDVQRFIAGRVDDPHRAADLTADVFLAVIDPALSYHPERGEPRAWLFGIVRVHPDRARRRLTATRQALIEGAQE